MADFNSSMPVRTQTAGDVVIKVADATVTSQQLTVNSDGSVNITDNGGSLTVDGSVTVSATNLDIRDLTFAADKVDASGSTVELGATTLAALESVTVQNGAGGSAVNIQDGGNSITVDGSVTVSATDLDIRDLSHSQDSVKIGDGTDFLEVNADGSINVIPQADVGTLVVNYDTSAAVAAGATDNHDLLFTNAGKLYQVLASASGKLKAEIQIETGSATGVFNTVCVRFNSTANPDCDMELVKYATIPAGARVRVIRTNKDTQAMDVYSTIVAVES
jgi:hypothetical protein